MALEWSGLILVQPVSTGMMASEKRLGLDFAAVTRWPVMRHISGSYLGIMERK